jgi:hypothetical protein
MLPGCEREVRAAEQMRAAVRQPEIGATWRSSRSVATLDWTLWHEPFVPGVPPLCVKFWGG